MLTNAALFEKELRALIFEEIERLKELLVNTSTNITGNGSIVYLQGAISALRGMEDIIVEAKSRTDQRFR